LFGVDVALSANGDTLAVGAYRVNVQAGAVYIYTAPAGTGMWTLQRALTAGFLSNDWTGYTVALSASGDRLAVGASGADSRKGTVLVFERAAGVWTQQATLTLPPATLGPLGLKVALTSSGDRVAAYVSGGVGEGAVLIFLRDGGGVWTFVQSLLPSDSAPFYARYFGMGLAFSATGNTLVISAPGEPSRGVWWSVALEPLSILLLRPGPSTCLTDSMCIIVCLSLWLLLRHFEWTGAAYAQQGLKKVGRGPALSSSAVGGVYGPISVSSDGRTVLVGSSYEEGIYAGAAYLWGRNVAGFPANEWVQLGDDLSYPAIQSMARTGHAIGLSGDATQIAVGGQLHNACSLLIRCPVLVFATLAGSPSLTDLWYRLCVCVSP
jgi:hypothetical protein